MKKYWRQIVFTLVIVLMMGLFFLLPLPSYIEAPGSAEPLSQFVTVNHLRDRKKGAYMLVTVGIGQATPYRWLAAQFNKFEDSVSQEELMGDEDSQAYGQIQRYYMENSINTAIQQAYKAAQRPYELKFLGIYVMDVLAQSSLHGKVQVGDTITAIDGHHFNSNQGFINYLKQKKRGSQVRITYQRQKRTKQATAKIMRLPQTKRNGIGITLTDRTKIQTKTPVKIDAGDIGGPSAGMMFSLQVYEQLTGNHLRAGRKIAGTGTIAADGTVGPIGGIDKKVVAANQAGASIFFAPNDPVTKTIKKLDPHYVNNYHLAQQTAKKIKTKMKIVPVKNFNDVITYLKK